ncbi:hypothetical protein OIU77_004248 [Salix suchowensis]|uniref:Co-chaperone protein p23 n=1 Tax=Salix suchowensis TaxID=1278906 RepID=A0ABQ9AWG9_9ROSI|nr:hypothetical protein OIU77_004248 [Salix suchowensis]
MMLIVQGCKTKAGLRNIICSIQKEEKGWWKRLLKSEEKPAPYIKVDWNKWCDEDDNESASDASDDNNAGGNFFFCLVIVKIKNVFTSASCPRLIIQHLFFCSMEKMMRAVRMKDCFIFLILRRLGEIDDNQVP